MVKRTKILYVINNFSLGGAERMLLDLCATVDREKFEIGIATVNGDGILLDEYKKLGVQLFIHFKQGKISWKSVRELRKVIRNFEPDIIHTHLFAGDTWGRIAAYLEGVPFVISTEHNRNEDEGFLKKWVKHFLSYMTSVIVTVSDAVKEYSIKHELISAKKLVTIPNGITIAKFPFRGVQTKRLGQEKISLMCVGRLAPQKGQLYALEALAKLIDEGVDARLVMVGDGPERENLITATKSLRITERVAFVGARSDIPELLTSADFFVFPSLYEGQGIVLLEAMSIGVPIIASEIPAVTSIIKDQETGYLFEPQNSDALADAIKNALMNSQEVGQCIERARKVVEMQFTVERMTKEYEDLYTKVLANPAQYALRFVKKQ